jgi:hypothetical protein
MLTIDGGVLTVYLEDRKLSWEEFFASCGLFFWRMVRLGLYSMVAFGGLLAAGGAIADYAEKLFDDAPQERLEFFVNVSSKLAIVLAALLLRLWFDLAQARVVHGNERRILRELRRSFKPAFRSGLYAQYLGIGGLAAASMAIGIWVWVNLPHGAMGASFVVLELVTIAQIAARLWMKAASARWVALRPGEAVLSAVPMEAALAPVIVETELNSPEVE